MFQQNVSVSPDAPAVIFTRGDDNPGVTVKNTGTNDIALGYVPSFGAGYILAPGSSVVWSAGKPLFISSTATGAAFVSDNTGNLFDADAVGASLIRQGLAQEIADKLKLTGVPPIRQSSSLLTDWTFTHEVGGSTSWVSDIFNVAEVDTLSVATFTTRGNIDAWYTVAVLFYDGVNAFQRQSLVYSGYRGKMDFAVPAEGTTARLLVQMNVGTDVAMDFVISVTGTLGSTIERYRAVPDDMPPIWDNYAGDLATGLAHWRFPNLVSGSRTIRWNLPTNGKRFNAVTSAAGTGVTFWLETCENFNAAPEISAIYTMSSVVGQRQVTEFVPPTTGGIRLAVKQVAGATNNGLVTIVYQ